MKPLPSRLYDVLREHQVLTVVVTTNNHQPYAAAVFYAADEQLRLYFLSDPSSRHSLALEKNPGVGGTIQRDRQSWQEIVGIQLTGHCRRVTPVDHAHAWAVYAGRFPFVKAGQRTNWEPLTRSVLWLLEPDWMRLIDNRAGFGHKEEWRRR